jgi:septum formation protein
MVNQAPVKIKYPILLASGSPRRQSLLKELGFNFEIKLKNVDETFPDNLKGKDVALFLAIKKADAYQQEIEDGYLVITADTIVCIGDEIMNKPDDFRQAFTMLSKLSGRRHEVITAVCIKTKSITDCFHVSTSVYFKKLTEKEIEYYINTHKPFDKAGGYGIQEWIGLVAVEKIEGSYHNVVGLPVKELYEYLSEHYSENSK